MGNSHQYCSLRFARISRLESWPVEFLLKLKRICFHKTARLHSQIFGYIVYVKIFIDLLNLIDYKKSIYDMQNGKDYFYQYNKFLHNLDFEKLF